ncbi:EID1-like F-box protein 3 [Phragmites australis]|uniref:EID1-like F-box protein 3 n=1 Tax=Phragmites australis TaxID=29695 RepID=UPI002D771D97|nr:EID1-like F-box protein 3 [Phragmites australis]
MSECTRDKRQLCGASSGADGSRIGSASYRDGNGGGAIGVARTSDVNTGILDEQVLVLVFRSIKFDPKALCTVACVSRRLRAVAERVLWRELCISRAPRMVASLTGVAVGGGAGAGPPPPRRIAGGWPALAKLLLFCCGAAAAAVPGHFMGVSRFSKSSGRSFLSRQCQGDLLYVSDPCEHAMPGTDDDVGVYRGVFRGFMRSRTGACLVGRQAALDARLRCPYCGARVWSMVAAGLVPHSAWRRLGAYEGRVEYYVCVSGHLHGNCWLARLTSSEGEHGGDSDDSDDASTEEDGHVAL